MVSTAKKQPERSTKSLDQHRATESWAKRIEKMSDLGDGYVLVKLDTGAKNATVERIGPSARAVPEFQTIPGKREISAETVRRLLNKVSNRPHHRAVEAPRAATAARRTSKENDEFMDNLRAQELTNRKRDIEEGRLLTSTALAERLELKTQALSKAVSSNRMFTLDGPSGRKFYPAFFDHPRVDRARIEAICQALGDLPGPSKWEFFTSPRASLNNLTPIDALERGMLAQVLRAAAAFVEH